MTRNNLQKKLNVKSIFILAIICILCFSFSFLFACGSTTSSTESSFTKNEVDEAIIKNGSFEFGSVDKKLTDYPLLSPTGWSRTSDNSSVASKVNSGLIKTSDDAWMELLRKMYSSSYFIDYAKTNYGFNDETIASVKDTIKTEQPSLNATELNNAVRDKIIEDYIMPNFANPKTHPNAVGDKVFMINNYLSGEELGKGTAQKITTSTTVTLKKNSYSKISVWLRTSNVTLDSSANTKDGANIRIISTLKTKSQPDYAIYGIVSNDVWTKYSIYVKSDSQFDTTLQVAVGLGFGNGSNDIVKDYVEGTLYVDDVVLEEITEETFNNETNGKNLDSTTFKFAGEKAIYENVNEYNGNINHVFNSNNDFYLYNLDFSDSVEENSTNYAKPVTLKTQTTNYATYDLNKSNKLSPNGDKISSETILGTDPNKTKLGNFEIANNSIKITNMLNTSGIITIDAPEFSVNAEEYVYISFVIKNGLNTLRNPEINVFVESADEKLTSALSTSTVGEDVYCGILVKNNFPKYDPENKYNDVETFKIKIYVGPKNVADLFLASHFATGEVEFNDFTLYSGKSYEYEKTNNVLNSPLKQTENYDFYSFFSEVANSTVVLNSSSVEFNDNSDTYAIYNESSCAGQIINAPTIPQNYIGITPDHIYIKESANSGINKRIGLGDTDGVAGLINTKYLDNYATNNPTLSNLAKELNYVGEKSIQPIMIYNKELSSYGFIGSNLTLVQGAFAKISVKVRVTGNAKANVYLTDVSKTIKEIETLDFTTNTNGFNQITDGAEYSKKLSFENITADMMDETGWLTVTFYVANGLHERNLRLELWNGSRDADVNAQGNSQGYVFFAFDSFSATETFNGVQTSSAFTEPEKWEDTFTLSSSVLFGKFDATKDEAIMHQRQLSQEEIDFNKSQTDTSKLVSYEPKYVWVKTENTIYAVYNTVDPIYVKPDAGEEEPEEETQSCITTTSPETFWLSFSSILLAAVLLVAIIMLFIKNAKLHKKRNRNDAKSHYKVTSRIKTSKTDKKVKKEATDEEKIDEIVEEQPEVEPAVEEQEEKETEISIDSVENVNDEKDEYIYTDVQNFGDDNEDK